MRVSGWLIILLMLTMAGYAWWRFAPQTLPPGIPGPARAPENPPLYKWRDGAGITHITDTPPTSGEFETIVVDPNTNVVPSTLPAGDPVDGNAAAPR
jgi:hypothetical protein